MARVEKAERRSRTLGEDREGKCPGSWEGMEREGTSGLLG
jgi:hypothetical protein